MSVTRGVCRTASRIEQQAGGHPQGTSASGGPTRAIRKRCARLDRVGRRQKPAIPAGGAHFSPRRIRCIRRIVLWCVRDPSPRAPPRGPPRSPMRCRPARPPPYLLLSIFCSTVQTLLTYTHPQFLITPYYPPLVLPYRPRPVRSSAEPVVHGALPKPIDQESRPWRCGRWLD